MSNSSDLGLLTATPDRKERELEHLVVYNFDGLFDAIPTKLGTGYGGSAVTTLYWYVVVIGRECPAAPYIGETFDTWSESIEVEVPEPPTGTGFE